MCDINFTREGLKSPQLDGTRSQCIELPLDTVKTFNPNISNYFSITFPIANCLRSFLLSKGFEHKPLRGPLLVAFVIRLADFVIAGAIVLEGLGWQSVVM